jgi:hypothetical protein
MTNDKDWPPITYFIWRAKCEIFTKYSREQENSYGWITLTKIGFFIVPLIISAEKLLFFFQQ